MKKWILLSILLLVGCKSKALELHMLESGHENYTFEYGSTLPTTLNHWIDWQQTDPSLETYDFKLTFNLEENLDENNYVLPGSYEGIYHYDGNEYRLNIEIKDTISPKLSLNVEQVKLKSDENKNEHPWLNYLVIEDFAKTTTTFEVLENQVVYKVSDESGNTSEISLPYEVEKKVVQKPASKPAAKPKPSKKPSSSTTDPKDVPFEGKVETNITGSDKEGFYEESDWIVIPY